MYAKSSTYLQPFGLELVWPNGRTKTFLIHDTDLALSYCSLKERKRVKRLLLKGAVALW